MRTRTLEITTNVGCALKCSYCPQTTLVQAYKPKLRAGTARTLTVADFQLYLQTVPTSVDIHFSGFAEPWHAPECMQMIQAAHERGHRLAVFTTADRLSIKDIDKLSRIPFKRFVVHLPDAAGEMVTQVDDAHLERLQELAAAIRDIEFITLGATDAKIAQVLGRRPSTRRVHSRAGNVSISGRSVGCMFTEDEITQRTCDTTLICREDRMLSNVLLPNGEIYFCAMDYGLEYAIGNLRHQSYAAIITGNKMRDIFRRLASRNMKILCRRCEYAQPGTYRSAPT